MLSDDECKQQLADKTDALLHAVTHSAQQLSKMLSQQLAAHTTDESLPQKIRESQLRKLLFPSIESVLTGSRHCFGAGFASHHYSTDHQQPYWFLEWWFKNPKNQQASCLELDQATQQRLDFSTFDWFKHRPEEQNVNLHGPYVDYICTSAYTLTASSPVMIDGVLAGVAVVDILVSVVEEELLSLSRQCRERVVIINPEGRVMVSSHPGFRTGALVARVPEKEVISKPFFRLFVPE